MDLSPSSSKQQVLLQRLEQQYHQDEEYCELMTESMPPASLPPLGRVLSVLLCAKQQDLEASHASQSKSKGSISRALAALQQYVKMEVEDMSHPQKVLEPLLDHVTKSRDRHNRKQVMSIIFSLSRDESVGTAIVKGLVAILESSPAKARIQLGWCIVVQELLVPRMQAIESSKSIHGLRHPDLVGCIPILFSIMESSSLERPSRLSVMAADCITLIANYAGDDATVAPKMEPKSIVPNTQIGMSNSSSSCLIQDSNHYQDTSEQASTSGRLEIVTKEELLWGHLDILLKFILLLRKWNEDGRPLFAKGLQQIAKSLNHLSKFRDSITLEKGDENDLAVLIAVLSSYWKRYGLLLLMDVSIVQMNPKTQLQSWLEGLQHSVQAGEVEAHDDMNSRRLDEVRTFFLTCLSLLLGRLSTQERESILQEYGAILLQTLFGQLHTKQEDVLGLAIAILRELLFRSDFLKTHTSKLDTVAPLLMDLLDERDSTSKVVIALVADYFSMIPCAPEMERLFGLLGSENLAQRQNALGVISELLNGLSSSDHDKAQTVRQCLAVHLLKRLGDTDLTNRIEVSKLFSKLDPEFVLPALVQLVYARDEKVRSAASASITSLLKEQKHPCLALCVLLDSTRNILQKQELPIHPGQIGASNKGSSPPDMDRIMRLLRSWAFEVQDWIEIIDIVLGKMFSEPSNPVMPRFLSQISSHLLSNLDVVYKHIFSFMAQQTELTDDFIVEIKKDDREVQQRLDSLIFQRLSPLLVLRTLPLAAFDGNSKYLYGTSWEMEKSFDFKEPSIASFLLIRACGEYEVQEVRKLSAELLGRCIPDIILPLQFERLGYAAKKHSFLVIKSHLFTLCNLVLLRGKTALDNPSMPFIQELLSQMLMWPCLPTDQDTYNVQHGCIDCLALMIVTELASPSVDKMLGGKKHASMHAGPKFIEEFEKQKDKHDKEMQTKSGNSVLYRVLLSIDGRHQANPFLLQDSRQQSSSMSVKTLSVENSPSTSTAFRVCMANILIRASQQIAIKNRPQFLVQVVPFILDFVQASKEHDLKPACLQVLFSVAHNFKEQVQSYAVDLFKLSLEIMRSNSSAEERLAAAKIVASLLSSADVVVNEVAPYLSEAMQTLEVISRIDISCELRDLCEKLLDCMTSVP